MRSSDGETTKFLTVCEGIDFLTARAEKAFCDEVRNRT
jgi:hypothetical protein